MIIKICHLFSDGSKMETGSEGSKSNKDSSSKDMKSNGDVGEERDNRNLVVDDDDDDDKLTDDGGDDGGGGRVRVVREQERRYANNARERYVGPFCIDVDCGLPLEYSIVSGLYCYRVVCSLVQDAQWKLVCLPFGVVHLNLHARVCGKSPVTINYLFLPLAFSTQKGKYKMHF